MEKTLNFKVRAFKRKVDKDKLRKNTQKKIKMNFNVE
jgi:hypothetical protein